MPGVHLGVPRAAMRGRWTRPGLRLVEVWSDEVLADSRSGSDASSANGTSSPDPGGDLPAAAAVAAHAAFLVVSASQPFPTALIDAARAQLS